MRFIARPCMCKQASKPAIHSLDAVAVYVVLSCSACVDDMWLIDRPSVAEYYGSCLAICITEVDMLWTCLLL
eukprot:6185533-Pleurochrysis_carterae.AAC.2